MAKKRRRSRKPSRNGNSGNGEQRNGTAVATGATNPLGDLLPRGALVNPYSYMTELTGQGVPKPGPMGFNVLRRIAERCEVVAAILNTRKNQVATFCNRVPVSDRKTPGWHIRLADDEKEPTESDKARLAEAEHFVENLHVQPPERIARRLRKGLDYPDGGLEGFIRGIIEDRLILDAVAIERVRTRGGEPFTAWSLDPATIRRIATDLKKLGQAPKDLKDAIRWLDEGAEENPEAAYVQIIDGRQIAAFTREELGYYYANPRNDINTFMYGRSELEQMISVVTAILQTFAYNQGNFSEGTIPEGLLALSGNYTLEQIESLRREFDVRMRGGTGHQHRLPVVAAPDATKAAAWIAMRNSNRDMEYGAWMDFLVNVASGIYQIDPTEINMRGYGGGQSPMFEKGHEAELTHSKDKGLRPLLRFVGGIVDAEFVKPLYDDLLFEWVNLEPEDEAQQIELATKRMQGGITTANEERAQQDLEPVEEDWADAPANPTLIQVYMVGKQQEMAEQQQAEGMGEEEAPPEDPDERLDWFQYGDETGQDEPEPEPELVGGEGGKEQQERVEKALDADLVGAATLFSGPTPTWPEGLDHAH